jgi:hypothetical protein
MPIRYTKGSILLLAACVVGIVLLGFGGARLSGVPPFQSLGYGILIVVLFGGWGGWRLWRDSRR